MVVFSLKFWGAVTQNWCISVPMFNGRSYLTFAHRSHPHSLARPFRYTLYMVAVYRVLAEGLIHNSNKKIPSSKVIFGRLLLRGIHVGRGPGTAARASCSDGGHKCD